MTQETAACGFLAVYVDGVLIAPDNLAKAVVPQGIRSHWRCSEAEWASSGDLVSRYEDLKERSTPMLATSSDDPAPQVKIQDVRRAQSLVGEPVWLSSRTRPDLSFGVSIMGCLLTKCPWKALEWGWRMLGYAPATSGYELLYHTSCRKT